MNDAVSNTHDEPFAVLKGPRFHWEKGYKSIRIGGWWIGLRYGRREEWDGPGIEVNFSTWTAMGYKRRKDRE